MNNPMLANDRNALILLQDVSKTYRKGQESVRALDGIDLAVAEKGMVAIAGPSGSGKSSLLHIIGAMDRPTNGEVIVAGQPLNALPEAGLTSFRRETVGFVFQSFNLIPNLSALENVMLPMEFNGVPSEQRHRRAKELLDRVDLGARLTHRPRELSGGEMQRDRQSRLQDGSDDLRTAERNRPGAHRDCGHPCGSSGPDGRSDFAYSRWQAGGGQPATGSE